MRSLRPKWLKDLRCSWRSDVARQVGVSGAPASQPLKLPDAGLALRFVRLGLSGEHSNRWRRGRDLAGVERAIQHARLADYRRARRSGWGCDSKLSAWHALGDLLLIVQFFPRDCRNSVVGR